MAHFNGKPCRTCGETLRYEHGSKQCVACSRRVKYAYNKSEHGKRMNRNRELLKSYGISIDQFEAMFRLANGKCEICNIELKPKGWSKDSVAIDHNHKTGKVRGILCNSCNRGIGHFFDDVDILNNSVKYLEKYAE